jgi:hypothetical protein
MLMRFHWGMAVGHTYTHNSTLIEPVAEEHSDEVLDTEGYCRNAQMDAPPLSLSEFSLNEHESHDWDGSDDEVDETSDLDWDSC